MALFPCKSTFPVSMNMAL